MNEAELRHNRFLDELVNHLTLVGESTNDVAWVMKDGIYIPAGSKNRAKLCDLIVGHYNRPVTCIELKGTPQKREKALLQLYSSRHFVRYILNQGVPVCKIAYYKTPGHYAWEIVKDNEFAHLQTDAIKATRPF